MPSSASVDVSFLDCPKKRKLTQHEKFRKANMLSTELATVISEASHTHFYRRLKLLKDLIDSWKSGTEVALADVDEGEDYVLATITPKVVTLTQTRLVMIFQRLNHLRAVVSPM